MINEIWSNFCFIIMEKHLSSDSNEVRQEPKQKKKAYENLKWKQYNSQSSSHDPAAHCTDRVV